MLNKELLLLFSSSKDASLKVWVVNYGGLPHRIVINDVVTGSALGSLVVYEWETKSTTITGLKLHQVIEVLPASPDSEPQGLLNLGNGRYEIISEKAGITIKLDY